MRRTATITVLSVVVMAALGGCKKEPPCKAGKLDAAWQSAPLSQLVPKDATVCEVPPAKAATEGQFWKPVDVHRANIDSVDAAQSNGWKRTGDNWYSAKGDFNSPKWSEFKGPEGELRIDVKEEGGGAMIAVKYTPKSK